MNRYNRLPIAFVMASTHHGTMIVNRHDYHQRAERPDDIFGVGHQLLTTSMFDPAEVKLALDLLEARRDNFGIGVVAIDCGANVGVHTIEWARMMNGWGRVIAIEAQERIYYALAGNIAINNCFNAKAIFAAAGATDGELRIPLPNYLKPASFGSLELKPLANPESIGQAIDYSPAATVPVRQMAIDSLGLDRLDFLKIDVEGMELEVLQGAAHSIRSLRPIILIEKIKTSDADLRRTLEAEGYTLFPTQMNYLAVHADDPVLSRVKVASHARPA